MTKADFIELPATLGSLLRLNPRDDVAVALRPIACGERLAIGGESFVARQDIPHGHKMSIRALSPGEHVRKFGWPIGAMTVPPSPVIMCTPTT